MRRPLFRPCLRQNPRSPSSLVPAHGLRSRRAGSRSRLGHVWPACWSSRRALTLTLLRYPKAGGRASRRERLALATLRIAILGLVIFSLCQPVLVLHTVVPQQSFVALVLDDSASMQIADVDGAGRGDWSSRPSETKRRSCSSFDRASSCARFEPRAKLRGSTTSGSWRSTATRPTSHRFSIASGRSSSSCRRRHHSGQRWRRYGWRSVHRDAALAAQQRCRRLHGGCRSGALRHRHRDRARRNPALRAGRHGARLRGAPDPAGPVRGAGAAVGGRRGGASSTPRTSSFRRMTRRPASGSTSRWTSRGRGVCAFG